MTDQAGKARLEDTLFVACGLAWAAAIIHVQAAIAHLDDSTLFAVLFEIVACAQFLWGIALYRRPGARLLAAGAFGSLGVAAVWGMSRTSGLPFGPHPWVAEPVGVVDVVATADELLLALLAGLHLGLRRIARPLTAAALCLILLSAMTPTVGDIH